MGFASSHGTKETSMAEHQLSSLTMLTEFFATEQIEAAARRTGFVKRTSKITGKIFLALVTFGAWSDAKTTFAQLAAKVKIPAASCGAFRRKVSVRLGESVPQTP